MSSVPPALWAGFTGVLGLLIGSFLNVVAYRVPAGLSVVRPGSACPACRHAVRGRDNVPVLSWVLLRGRCRDCAAPISARYPLVEAGTGLLFVLVSARLAAAGELSVLAACLVVTAAGVALALIDLEHGRLPFSITGVASLLAAAALAIAWWAGAVSPAAVLVSAAVWFAVYGGIWFLTAGRGMGLGDVALAPLLGAVLGSLGLAEGVVGLVAGFVLGAVVGIALMLSGRAARGSRIAFGPFMLLGAAVGLFVGAPLGSAYLGLTGLA
ncbi:prepilin peptidase [Nocardioides sp. MAH-18]|uniref:Prepilin peptidase n=1 Tax=Nocardioides agri TaxID=2682843 RepID=A0A6L6XRG7_9ACTN|nr:prepilin peptidase [Nocardioides sp. CGMCC 1.13656]MVQ49362.1 prepilin peptidase [Nocardioides sp. MAH-18]